MALSFSPEFEYHNTCISCLIDIIFINNMIGHLKTSLTCTLSSEMIPNVACSLSLLVGMIGIGLAGGTRTGCGSSFFRRIFFLGSLPLQLGRFGDWG
jgi:hypothetical protein